MLHGEPWSGHAGKRQRLARIEIARLLIDRGAAPDHAFKYAVSAGRNYEIASMLPLAPTSAADLKVALDRLRQPSGNAALAEAVRTELKNRSSLY